MTYDFRFSQIMTLVLTALTTILLVTFAECKVSKQNVACLVTMVIVLSQSC